MKPKFATEQAWQQAEILMQPAYIRLVDQIRRQTEEHEDEIKVSYEEVTDPYPSNLLCLQPKMNANNPGHTGNNPAQPLLKVDIWDLCFQVCFVSYEPIANQSEQPVVIDTSLFDPSNQEVDWNKLDNKAKATISQVFARFRLLSNA